MSSSFEVLFSMTDSHSLSDACAGTRLSDPFFRVLRVGAASWGTPVAVLFLFFCFVLCNESLLNIYALPWLLLSFGGRGARLRSTLARNLLCVVFVLLRVYPAFFAGA